LTIRSNQMCDQINQSIDRTPTRHDPLKALRVPHEAEVGTTGQRLPVAGANCYELPELLSQTQQRLPCFLLYHIAVHFLVCGRRSRQFGEEIGHLLLCAPKDALKLLVNNHFKRWLRLAVPALPALRLLLLLLLLPLDTAFCCCCCCYRSVGESEFSAIFRLA